MTAGWYRSQCSEKKDKTHARFRQPQFKIVITGAILRPDGTPLGIIPPKGGLRPSSPILPQ